MMKAKDVPAHAIMIGGRVYDLRPPFKHPGGESVLLPFIGGRRDATRAFDSVHGRAVLDQVPCIGTIEGEEGKKEEETREMELKRQREQMLVPMDSVLNVREFAVQAQKILPPSTWAFFASGADDEIS